MADVMVVARRPQTRWELAAALGVPARAACAPDLAASRLAHPSGTLPDALLLVVAAPHDVLWLRRHHARALRRPVPVVALVTDSALTSATGAAGARVVIPPDGSAAAVRQALADVTRPAPVIDIGTARSA